jgi:TonB family protein
MMIKDNIFKFLWLISWTVTTSSVYAAEDTSSSTPAVSKQADAGATAPGQLTVDAYVKHLSERVKSKWITPKVTKPLNSVVSFTLDSDGQIVDLKLKQPSGDKVADQAAMSTVKRAAPFGVLPKEFKGRFTMIYTFQFQPGGGDARDFRFNGVPLEQNNFQISRGGATLKPLDTNSPVERKLAEREASMQDKLAALQLTYDKDEKRLSANDRKLASELQEMASCNTELKNYTEAESLFQKAIAIDEKTNGHERELAKALYELGSMYCQCNKLSEAEPALKRAVDIEDQLKSNDSESVTILKTYAGLLYKLNRADDANKIYQRLRDMKIPSNK